MDNKIGLSYLSSMLSQESGKGKKICEEFIRQFFLLVEENLVRGENIRIKGFGSFRLVDIEERKSINVVTGEEIILPPHKKIVFMPSREIAEAINEPFNAFETVELADNGDEVPSVELLQISEEDPANVEKEDLPEKIEDREEDLTDERFEEQSDEELLDDEATSEAYLYDIDESIEKESDKEELEEPEEAISMASNQELISSQSVFPIIEGDSSSESVSDLSDEEEENQGPSTIVMEEGETRKYIEDKDTSIIGVSEKEEEKKNVPEEETDESPMPIIYLQENEEQKAGKKFWWGYLWGGISGIAICVIIALIGFLCGWYYPAADTKILTDNSLQESPSEFEEDNQEEVNGLPNQIETVTMEEDSSSQVPTQSSDEKVFDKVTTTRYLTTIARDHYGNFNLWPYIYEENKAILGHPDRIKPGTQVVVPSLSKYGIDPKNPQDIQKAKNLAMEIYARFNK